MVEQVAARAKNLWFSPCGIHDYRTPLSRCEFCDRFISRIQKPLPKYLLGKDGSVYVQQKKEGRILHIKSNRKGLAPSKSKVKSVVGYFPEENSKNKEILQVLKNSGNPLTIGQIGAVTGNNADTVRSRVSRLYRAGLIKRVARGVYTL